MATWKEAVVGNPATSSLQHLTLNLLVLVGLMTGVYFGVSDVVVGLKPVNSVFDFFLILFFGWLYWLSRFRGRYVWASHILTTVGLVLCSVNFFINAGIRGPTLMVFLAVFGFLNLLHTRRASIVYLALGLSLAAGCLLVQYIRPEWIVPYLSATAEYWDVTMTFLFCFIAIYAVMRMVLGFFDRILEQNQKAQAAALQSEKMAALGEILANISHEINNPVGVIGSALEYSREWWVQELPKASRVLSELNEEGEAAFWAFLKAGVQAGEAPRTVDSRTLRAQRTAMEHQLEEAGVRDPWSTAQDLVILGLPSWETAWQPLAEPQAGEALEFAVKALLLERSNRNAARAYGKLQSLVKALKAYSRSENPEDEVVPVALAEGLDTVLTLYTSSIKEGLEIQRDYHAVGLVAGKPDELIQVWTNLVQNALQAMDHRGVLTLQIAEEPGWARVTVADSGPGISVELRKQIFEPFFTTKPRGLGTGLGLGIVQKIVQAHRGTIEVGEAPGGGAQFVVRLPLLPAAAP